MLDEEPLGGYSWSGGETDQKANDFQARLPVARDMERHAGSVEAKREAKVRYRKTEAQQCQKFACIDPDDEEFKRIMKHVVRRRD